MMTKGETIGGGRESALLLAAVLPPAILLRLQFLGRGVLGGTDSFYHLRRAELAAAGSLDVFDAWTNFPFGQAIHWPRLYGEILGAALEFGGETTLMLLPVLFGLATLVALGFWARRLLGAWTPAALLAAAVSPALVFSTAAGAIDHHSLEGFLAAAVLGAVGRGGRAGSSAAGLLLGFGLLTAPSAPILFLPVIVTLAAGRRPAAAGFLLAGALIVTMIGMFPLAERLYGGDPWLVHARETKPLLTSLRDLARAVVILGPGLLLLPLAAALWWRRRGEGVALAALAATATALPMALFAERFVVFLALPCALALAEAARWFAARRGRGRALALLWLALLPMLRGSLELGELESAPTPAVAAALHFLRDATPPAGDPSRPESRPAYGVVSAWDLGHQVLALGRRPAVANAFHGGGAGRKLAREILFHENSAGTRSADRHDVRYLLLTDPHPLESWRRPGDPPLAASLFGRLYLLDDHGLGWRRVFASTETFAFDGGKRPAVQIWERAKTVARSRPLRYCRPL